MKLPRRSRVARNSILLGAGLLVLGVWRTRRHPELATPTMVFVIAVGLLVLGITLVVRSIK